jgi:hypothetical protein
MRFSRTRFFTGSIAVTSSWMTCTPSARSLS